MPKEKAVAEDIMFALIRFELFSKDFPAYFRGLIDSRTLKELYSVSQKFDMAHLVADALEKNGIIAEGSMLYDDFSRQRDAALFRYEGQKYVADRLFSALEAAEIDFIPLKGSVLRGAYPEPWMRTSCDIDVLVRKEDVERAAELCVSKLGFVKESSGAHDIRFFCGNVLIELHFELVEALPRAAGLLADVFETAEKADGSEHKLIMDDAEFCLYHIAHIEKHFLKGGCGVRSIADISVFEKTGNVDIAKRDALIKKAGLSTFAKALRELSAVWFEQKAPTEISERLGNFILKGGAFGNVETRVAMGRANRSGTAYLIKRVFPAPRQMKVLFPILGKYPILMPVMYIKRLAKRLSAKTYRKSISELKANASVDEKSLKETMWLLQKLDILSDAEGLM